MIDRFSIQGGFPIKKLGGLVEFLDHKRRAITAKDRTAGPYPYYGANGQQDSVGGYIFDEPLILLAEDGGHFDAPDRGIAYRIEGKSWVNNHAHVLRPISGVDLPYLCRVLENYDIRPYISGTTRAKLTKGQAERIEIPLPPLPEQRRIAEILDQADALRRLRRQSLSRLSDLGQAIFYEMFGGLRSNTFAFPMSRLGDIAEIKLGKMLDKGKTNGHARRPYLRNANVRWFEFDLSDISEMEIPDKDVNRFSVQNGDLLICEGGEPGRCAIWQGENSVIFYQKALHRARVDGSKILAQFLNYWFHLANTEGLLVDSVTSATIAHLTSEKIKELRIALPTIQKQQDFVARLSVVDVNRRHTQSALDTLNSLFTSLQYRAFRGEL